MMSARLKVLIFLWIALSACTVPPFQQHPDPGPTVISLSPPPASPPPTAQPAIEVPFGGAVVRRPPPENSRSLKSRWPAHWQVAKPRFQE